MIGSPWLIAIALNSILAAIAWAIPKKLLTTAGLLHAWALGILVWGTLGRAGYGVIMAYFLVGSAVTRVGFAEKEAAGIAEQRSGARGPENVWGSAFTAALCALGIWGVALAQPSGSAAWTAALLLGYVASLSTKLSDTCASEIGKAYGKRTFLITTLKPVPAGTEGAVSLEGTLAGVVASLFLALLAWAFGLISGVGVLLCAIAAFVATNLESLIGATIQEQVSWLTNEVVNVINTLIGAAVAMVLVLLYNQLLT
ncbi:MAG: TIGR00297 family protein [Elainellaceae cyanobacterium]